MSTSLCLSFSGSSESDVGEVRCPSIALWLHYHLRYSESSEPTKSPPNTQPNPRPAHVAVLIVVIYIHMIGHSCCTADHSGLLVVCLSAFTMCS